MTQATLTPKYVNALKPGKKYATIKDQQDTMWLCPPGLLGSFTPGSPISVEYETAKFGDGTERPKITGVVHGTTNGSAPAQEAPRSNGHSPNQGREIFITGVVGRAMGSGKFSAADIAGLALAAAETWNALSAPTTATKTQADPDPNDSIPF